jgi:hypothetical protein
MSDERDELIDMLQGIRMEREAKIIELLGQRGKDLERIHALEAAIEEWRGSLEQAKIDIAATHTQVLAMIERSMVDDDSIQ